MGYTIEDMLIVGREKYQMEMIAGEKGWSNSISWLHMVEDTTLIQNFWGREVAVTTGLGFSTEEALLSLVKDLVQYHGSGLIINVGNYILEVPESVKKMCDDNDLPLLLVPWEVHLADMMKDFSIRIFMQDGADQEISTAMIAAIREPENQEKYREALLPYFDVDGSFQVALITTQGLDSMDTVERRKLANQMQIYLEGISHNGNFFYYDSYFVLILNDVQDWQQAHIVEGMLKRAKRRTEDMVFYVGVGSMVQDVSNLSLSFTRAKNAVKYGIREKQNLVYFDEMGVSRLFYSIEDHELLHAMEQEPLRLLDEYDAKHGSNLVETLEMYLKCDGSIQKMAAEMYTHRNTVIYRVNKIKDMLGSDFCEPGKREIYIVAFYIRRMRLS